MSDKEDEMIEEHKASAETSELLYRANVEIMAKRKSTREFSNGAPIHAAIIFESFFRHAEDSVKIFCKNLSSSVFNKAWLLKAAQEANERGVNISVLVRGIADKTPFSEWLRASTATPGVAFIENTDGAGKAQSIRFNYATMDGHAYRFEPDENEISASACMNNVPLTAQLDALHVKLSA